MTTNVVHCKRQPYDIYIGRPSIWGNCFWFKGDGDPAFRVADRTEAIEKYKEWIVRQPELMARIGFAFLVLTEIQSLNKMLNLRAISLR